MEINKYLVITPTGYTKHYYAGTERIASRIGEGRFRDMAASHCVPAAKIAAKKISANTGLPSTYYNTNSFTYLYTLTDNTHSTAPIYWTHGDHLGSTAWVTDTAGAGVQHFRYLPFGEPLYSKKTGTFSSRYTFSGKERDAESGLNYFGARYYNSDLSIWLSVDPMADKYPSTSPYTYCGNNPVRLVDPEGKEIGDFFDYNGCYLGTDGIDDGKIYITTQEDWDKCSLLEIGMTLITIPYLGFSRKPSQTDLNEDAILNILSFYNTTGEPVTIENYSDNSLLSTHVISGKLTANISNWRWNQFLDNSYDIKSSFDHEKGHFKQRKEIGVNAMANMTKKECEKYAIEYQQNQLNYSKTSAAFKENIEKLKSKTQ